MKEIEKPIFIHSLWRAGSTWLFDRFRRGGGRFWCYQEPFHEALIDIDKNAENLLRFDENTVRSLRHPKLIAPYFQEFYEIRSGLVGKFSPCISYESFFDTVSCPDLLPYTQALISNAQGVPVLQCCRSFGRVAFLKKHFPGTHILLWRDPVSQWFSYQINDYFDTVGLLILNAENPPLVFQYIAQEIGLIRREYSTVQAAYEKLFHYSWNARHRYLVFYSLWLYNLIENLPLCFPDLNIDKLSECRFYRDEKQEQLAALGILGLDFSGCAAPVTYLSKDERQYFKQIEDYVEKLFLFCGYDSERIDVALEKREQHRPRRRASIADLRRNAAQARAMAMRYANRLGKDSSGPAEPTSG